MADSIDLTGGKDDFERQKAEAARVPPPAALPPGVTGGNPPLPTGQAVRATNPKYLTDEERQKMEAIGWKEGEPVPSNMADIVAAHEQARAAETQGDLPLPASPTTPPVEFTPVALEDLPPEQRAAAKAMVDESLAAAASQSAARQRQAVESRANIAQAGGHRVAAPTTPPVRPATGTVPNVDHVPQAAPPPQVAPAAPQAAVPPPAPVAAPEPATEAPKVETAYPGSTALAYCPHCGWDMAAEDIPDPDESDRLVFLQTVLGQKPFEKRYELLGGAMIVGFRTLTASEIDAVYQQAFREREAGEIQSEMEYWERVNRYRMFLQMAFSQAGEKMRPLPDGLSKETNPHGTGFWTVPEGTAPLKAIEAYIMYEILPTESLSRIVQNACAQFNRLVAKLEARVEDPDFWKGTEQPA